MLLPSTFSALLQQLLPHLSVSLQVSPAWKMCLQYYHNQTQQGYAMVMQLWILQLFSGPVTKGREFVIKACGHSLALPCRQGQLYQTRHSKAVELSLFIRCIPVLPTGLGPVCKLRPNNRATGSGHSRSSSAKNMKPWKTAWQQPWPTPSTFHGNTGNTPAVPWMTSSGTNDNYRLHRSFCKWFFVLQQHPGTPGTGQNAAVPSVI